MNPDAVRARWAELQDASVQDDLRRACEGEVVSHAYYGPWEDDHLPGPAPRGRPEPLPGPAKLVTRLGLDSDRQPVISEFLEGDRVGRSYFITWVDGRAEVVSVVNDRLEFVQYTLFEGDQPVARFETWGHSVEVTRYRYDDGGRLELALRVYDANEGGWGWTAGRYGYEGDRLMREEHVVGSQRLTAEDYEAALAAASEACGLGEFSSSVTWDGRILAREEPLAEPSTVLDGLAAPLADALVAAAAGHARPLAFVWVELWFQPHRDHPAVPRGAAADVALRDRARATLGGSDEFVHAILDTAELHWLDHASPELLRRIRQALQSGAELPTATLARKLATELNARDWGDVADGFVALVRAPGPDPDAPTREAIGAERVRALHMSLRKTPRSDPVPSRLSDRAELAAVLAREGIPEPGAERVVQDATWGIVLEPGGSGETRLGGRPVLAAGSAFPVTNDGRPLTHLATLALAELPDVEGRDVLPADGYLSFFADLEDEDSLWEPIEPGDELSDRFAVLHTPGGTPTHEPDGPGLKEMRVQPRARLQLRHVGFGYADYLYGLDAVAERTLERIVQRANGDVAHQLLGFPATVQDDPRHKGEVSLLHIVDDWKLEFSFLDAGSVHFYAAPDDVRAQRWDQVTLWTSTG